MIYSKKLQSQVPVSIEFSTSPVYEGKFTKYVVKDKKIPIGHVHLTDTSKGVKVNFIKNMYPELYSGFGKIADQIEVEHCMKRGLENFEIVSDAALNSHALHYLRGKRFFSKDVEDKIKEVIAITPKGRKFDTKFLGSVAMYMPEELISKYKELIKKCPLLIK